MKITACSFKTGAPAIPALGWKTKAVIWMGVFIILSLFASSFARAGDLKGCLRRLQHFNQTATTAKIKLHPQDSMPVVSWTAPKLSESDQEAINDALRFCAAQGLNLHYNAKGEHITALCTMTDYRTGLQGCDDPGEQPKQKLVDMRK